MEQTGKKIRQSKKKELLVETGTMALKALGQGILTGFGVRLGTSLYDKLEGRKTRTSVADLRKIG